MKLSWVNNVFTHTRHLLKILTCFCVFHGVIEVKQAGEIQKLSVQRCVGELKTKQIVNH